MRMCMCFMHNYFLYPPRELLRFYVHLGCHKTWLCHKNQQENKTWTAPNIKHSFIHFLHSLDIFEIQASLFSPSLSFSTHKIINTTNFAFICRTAEQQKAVLSIIPEQVCAELNAKLKRVTNCCALEKWGMTVGQTDRVLLKEITTWTYEESVC